MSREIRPSRDIIGHNIAAFRRAFGLSQEDLGEALGCSRDRVSRIEHGKAGLEFTEIPALCDTFGLDEPAILYRPNAFIGRFRDID